ncbi:MAG: PilZ domain-containing protein [Planctomycetes bacterium]|nr:PilZ domain-containing protein [Planctomycetota bacterium]
MKQLQEKRQHRRLAIRLSLGYHKMNSETDTAYHSTTKNVSTGGVYFETTDEGLNPGDILEFEMGVPPGDDRFPRNMTISTTGEIMRRVLLEGEISDNGKSYSRFGVAAQFQQGFDLGI